MAPAVSLCRRASARMAGQQRQQGFVDRFHRIVAALVVAVDQALAGGDGIGADVGAARPVFLVAQQAVVAVIRFYLAPRIRSGADLPAGRLGLP
jgi:hypothetical protein